MSYAPLLSTPDIGLPLLRRGKVRDVFEAGDDTLLIVATDRISAFDHVLGAEHADRPMPFEGPYTPEHAFHEPFVLYGFLAGPTSTIELATGVVILSQRQTALAAKQAAEVQLLSGGRLRLGRDEGTRLRRGGCRRDRLGRR